MNSKEHMIKNQEKYIELCNQGKTRKEISAELGVSTRTVYEYQTRTGVHAKRADDYSERLKQYKKLCEEGYTNKEIAEKLHISKETAVNYRRISDVRPRLSESGSGRIPKVDEHFFDVIDTEEKAYILGFICADGCVDTSNRNIAIAISIKDIDILTKIKKATNCGNDIHIRPKANLAVLNLSSKYLVETLSKYGVTRNKTATLPFPAIKDEMYRHFFRGHCDGDGCVHKRQVAITIGSDDFCDGYVKYLESKFNKTISYAYRQNSYHSVVFSRKDFDIVDWMYKDANIYLERKYESYIQNWLNYAEKRRSRG